MASGDERRILLDQGVAAFRDEDYLRALNIFSDLYAQNAALGPAEGLSYYGLCCALVEKRYDDGADLCRHAISAEEGRARHHINLTRLFMAAGRRQEALSAVEEGLAHAPDDEELIALRRELGLRARPPVPFLARKNPINRALGRARHVRKSDSNEDEQDP